MDVTVINAIKDLMKNAEEDIMFGSLDEEQDNGLCQNIDTIKKWFEEEGIDYE